VFEREDESSTNSEESSDESDSETSDSHDTDADTRDTDVKPVDCVEHSDDKTEQNTRTSHLPRIKMPKSSSSRRSRPSIEVVNSSDSNVHSERNEQLD